MSRCSVFFLMALVSYSHTAASNCLKSDVVKVLTTNGYAYTELADDGDFNFTIAKDGERIRAWVEPDGDLSLRKHYRNASNYDNNDMADLMRKYKYLSAYLDEDGDLVLGYDYPSWGSCPEKLREVINLFLDITSAAKATLINME